MTTYYIFAVNTMLRVNLFRIQYYDHAALYKLFFFAH